MGYEAAEGLLLHPSRDMRAETANKRHIGPHHSKKQMLAGLDILGYPWETKMLLGEGDW